MHWSHYNRELVNRGSLTVHFGDDLAVKWVDYRERGKGSRGRPVVYPDQVVLLGLLLQQIFRLPLRQTVGLMRSVLTLSGVALPAPDPSTLCRRRRHLILSPWPKGGGASDRPCCYVAALKRRLRLITPPRSRAVLHQEPGSLERNRAIKGVRFLAHANWKPSQHSAPPST